MPKKNVFPVCILRSDIIGTKIWIIVRTIWTVVVHIQKGDVLRIAIDYV